MKRQDRILQNAELISKAEFSENLENLNGTKLHYAISRAIMADIQNNWKITNIKKQRTRRAYYFSAEFLMGRMINNNLLCLGFLQDMKEALKQKGIKLSTFEEVEDAALGNGGLGRLAACFLDSAAALDLPLDGYGIRYRYGLFKQTIKDGFQSEEPDDWTRFGDPWSIRKEQDSVIVEFKDFSVNAVPYDMPIIGYRQKNIGTLRLWQPEALEPFSFLEFNKQNFEKAVSIKNKTEDIGRVLYPNDEGTEGKILRFRQQYFFCSASLQDILKKYQSIHGNEFSKLPEFITIQLNDTHPTVAIPELIRQLMKNGVSFKNSLGIVKEVFNYTNHTILPEALEKWDIKIINKVTPEISKIIKRIDLYYREQMRKSKVEEMEIENNAIVQGNTVHMANLACFVSKYINGVAEIHTEILKKKVLNFWYRMSPGKFTNKTNGITQRRWLALCNPKLSKFVSELLGTDKWKSKLTLLKALEQYADDTAVLDEFLKIRKENKQRLKEYIEKKENFVIDENTIFDVQIKRLHEYKRQLLNILAILEIYYRIIDGTLTDFAPTTFIFAAKSAPGYKRAKGIIKLINEVAKLIENDDRANKIIKVKFLSNYNVSLAEKIIAAADVSEQISTAGTEASGTGNMKLMLNGAVTLGTYDGANIEIVRNAGEQNNYIFGARVEELEQNKNSYNPLHYYETNPSIKRCLDTLIDGTLSDGGTGCFKELYDSILYGADWHKADNFYLLYDFDSFVDAKIRVNNDYKNKYVFLKKCLMNMANAGEFSSDRTINEYAKEIWKIKKIK